MAESRPTAGIRSPASSMPRASACGASGPSPSASPTGSAAPTAEVPLVDRLDGRPARAAPGGRRCSPARAAARSAGTGEYREVVEPERLVLTVTDQPDEDEVELLIVVLSDLGDGRTEMRFQQRGGMTPEQYERAGSGWSALLRPGRRAAGRELTHRRR